MYELVLHKVMQDATAVSNPPYPLFEYLIQYIQIAYEKIIVYPLMRLLLHGPSLGGWGFWNGLDLSVICSQKTNLLPEFWQSHPAECVQLVSKGFYGAIVLVETVVYFLLIWVGIKCVASLCQHCGCKRGNPNKCHTSSHHTSHPPSHDIVDH